jgi:hypothetical protein
MRTIVPFLTTRHGAFDDAALRLMSEAFEEACTVLGGRIKHRDREIIANRIIEEVTRGERNSIRLRDTSIAAWRR